MRADWVQYCRVTDFTVKESDVEVCFGAAGHHQASGERHHRVSVEDLGQEYRLRAFVVRQAVVNSLADLPVTAWSRNWSTSLVGFRIDERGRLVGEAWVPKAGLSAQEFQLYVRTLAAECDRFEYVLTGRDAE
jgi:hypothetical protein